MLFKRAQNNGSDTKEQSKRLKRWQKVVLGVLAAILVVVAIVFSAVVPAVQSGLALARTVKGAIASKTWDEQTAQQVQDQAHALHERTQGPVWGMLSALPGIGEDVAFVCKAAEAVDTAAPSMGWLLGMDAPRKYLVVAQGNSELRSTGGFPGAYAIVTVDHGSIAVGDFMSANAKFPRGSNQSGCTDEEQHVVFDLLRMSCAYIPGDANVTPDFPRAAQMMIKFKEVQGFGKMDAVVAADPFVMQAFLGLVGEVKLSDGTSLDGTNTARFILHDVYNLAAKDADQNTVFYEAGKLVVQKIMGGISSVNPLSLVRVVREQIQTNHIFVYFNDAPSQSAAVVMECDGAVSHDPTIPQLGVYINSVDSSKDSWYTDVRTSIGKRTKNKDGSISYTAVTTIRNTATLEEMENSGDYINKRVWDRTDYAMRNSIIIMAPAEGDVTDLKIKNADIVGGLGKAKTTLYGNALYGVSLWTKLQETTTITYRVTTSTKATQELEVWQTPMCQVFD